MEKIFRILLTFNSTSPLLIMFLVNNHYTLGSLLGEISFLTWLNDISDVFSYVLYIAFIALTSWLSIFFITTRMQTYTHSHIDTIERSDHVFLPSYLAYFFVGLGISEVEILAVVYGLIFLLCYCTQSMYFNPILLLFGYNFYFANTVKRVKLLIISRESFSTGEKEFYNSLIRLNDYTYIHKSK